MVINLFVLCRLLTNMETPVHPPDDNFMNRDWRPVEDKLKTNSREKKSN